MTAVTTIHADGITSIDDNQESKLTTIFRPIRHKVVRPDVVLVFSTVTDTAILTATRKTPLAMLFSRDLHVLSLPKSMYSLVIDSPVTLHQQVMNALGSESWPLSGQGSHLAKQASLIIRSTRLVTLRTARLTEYSTGSTFRYFLRPQTATHFDDCSSATFGAYQFPFAASFRISISRACSATSFFRRAFSF